MRRQKALIHKGDWDFLIILDACRADYFEEECRIPGRYERVLSAAPCTVLWLERTFPLRYDVTYVSANPFVSSRGRPPHVAFDARRHFAEVVDAWRFGWDEELGTVPPEAVNRAVLRTIRERKGKRMIIHYIQPHFPYIGEVKLHDMGVAWTYEEFRGAVPRPNRAIEAAVRAGILSLEDLRRAYRANLRAVLRYVDELLDFLEGRVVITSDHGEMLGEDGLLLHECHYRHEILFIVPWLELRL